MADTPSAELLERFYRDHDEAAAEELFHRYAGRLTALARSRLSQALAKRVDAEDVVQSAYRSFFLLAREGKVLLRETGDLWRLLVRITLRKVYRNARRHRAECRSVEREHSLPEAMEAVALSREPTPADVAALLDELRGALAPLNEVQRRMIELRLQGEEVEAIAAEVRRSTRTVRRILGAFGEELARRLSDPPRPAEEGLLAYRDVVLLRQLGQGGMGKVYRARWSGSSVPVAVKLLRKPLRGHGTAAARFREEAAVLARLRHPNIVAIHGIGLLPDGGHFLVMNLVVGSDLARQPRPPVEVALRWVAEAADAIDYAHGMGVVVCAQFGARIATDAAEELRSALATLGTDYIDILTLYYVEQPEEWEEITSSGGALRYLQDAKRDGVVRRLGITSHQRKLAARMAASGLLDVIMIRYNAAHRGAEREVFPVTQPLALPVIAYTALRWGALLQPTPDDPPGFSVPRAPDWYRFVLQHPAVAVTLAAPQTRAELEEDLQVLKVAGPLPDETYAALTAHGDRVRRIAGAFR